MAVPRVVTRVAQKAERSAGVRLVTSFWSMATCLSTQVAPAFWRSVLRLG